ncbi:MAG: ATP-binding protein [Deltaproteobacteria bacterium]|nr:ATP-binding protein [Deltaproteobacteria bacterium]
MEPAQNKAERVSTFYNPYIAGPPIIDPNMFFGREQILQKIINILYSNYVLITGPRRIGKTTLLYQLTNRLTTLNDNYYFIPVIVDLQGTPEDTFFHTIMDDIVTATRNKHFLAQPMGTLDYDRSKSNYNHHFFGKDLGKIIRAVQQNHPGKTVKLVLLMDEMDVMNTYNQQIQAQLRSIFHKPFAPNLGAVVAGVNLSQEWKRETSPFYNMFVPFTLASFSPEQARRLIVEPVKDTYHYDESAIQLILNTTEGHPFHLQQLCMEVIHYAYEKNRRHITQDDVEMVLSNIEWSDSATQSKVTITTTVLAEKQAAYSTSNDSKKDDE